MSARVLVLLAAAFALVLAAGASAAAEGPKASASALAALVDLPGGDETVAGAVSAPPLASANLGGYEYPEDGSVISFARALTGARTGPGSAARAQASASLADVVLFGGEIRIGSVTLRADASATSSGSGGTVSASSLDAVVVLGEPVDAIPNLRVPLGDWGYLVLLEQAELRQSGADGSGHRAFVTAVRVVLTGAHGGLPAGTELLVGYAEAAARAPAAVESPDEADGSDTGSDDVAAPARDPSPQPPGARNEPPSIVRNPPPGVRPNITGRGYVFPIYGPVSFTDDFGAPRASTGWHHGTDLFARRGAPVLAVADGTVFSVGWNPVGGWRLWLRDGQGNEYYYAHLSAYTPLAREGARVAAGDVLGFVGETGDARGTPPHLHFEVHPVALLGLGYDGVVNPFPYLSAWRASRDASFTLDAPAPGAVLLDVQDISTASGLLPGPLERALGLYGDGALLPLAEPGPPELVGLRPGF